MLDRTITDFSLKHRQKLIACHRYELEVPNKSAMNFNWGYRKKTIYIFYNLSPTKIYIYIWYTGYLRIFRNHPRVTRGKKSWEPLVWIKTTTKILMHTTCGYTPFYKHKHMQYSTVMDYFVLLGQNTHWEKHYMKFETEKKR